MDPLQVIVIVREDLPHSQRAVQACHAVAELVGTLAANSDRHSMWRWLKSDKTIVMYGVSDTEGLSRLDQNMLNHAALTSWATFREPDLFDEMTAIAVGPITKEQTEKIFSGYKLL